MASFKVGDIVQLKSGGPQMTVADANLATGEVQCKWFTGGKLNVGYFPPEALERGEEQNEGKRK